MRTETEVLRVISQNIANAQTVAYRRQVPVNHVQFDQLLETTANAQLQLPKSQFTVAVDMQQSTLKSTGDPLNVALDGAGFFMVQTAHGPALTRRGDFHLTGDGTLVSFGGDAVLGQKGVIQIGSGKPAISVDGSVSIGGAVVDQLRVVNVSDKAHIESLGDGTYRASMSDIEERDIRPSVRQGFLEGSNVAPVNEMIQLMETVRRFETEQKFARAYDGMLEKAISELGKIG
jgi:flagellar basal-body rod protein FlgG